MNASPRPLARNFRLITGQGNLRAFCDVQCGPFLISGVRIIQEADKKPWASLPQRQAPDGRWFPVVSCSDKALERAILDEALAYWKEEVGAQ